VHKVDPLARQVGKSSEVLGRREPLRLEAPHLTRRSRAALLLATGTAQAGQVDQVDGLPDGMTGAFCKSEYSDELIEIYHFEGICLDNVPPNTNEVHFWKTGLSWPESNPTSHCNFESIEEIEIPEGDMGQEPGYIYSVHANCRDATGKTWTDDFILEPTEHGMTLKRAEG